jgi:hypothetical protein
MADRLLAINVSTYLTPQTVVNRLKTEFSYVETDGDGGRRYILETIARLKSDSSFRLVGQQVVEKLERLKDRTIFVCFGDDAGSDLAQLSTYVIPGMPLVFEYASVAHEQAVLPLLQRCAAALGYELVKDRRSANSPGFSGPERRDFRQERRAFVDRRASPKERRKTKLEE